MLAAFNGSCQLVLQIHFPLLWYFRLARPSNEEWCEGAKPEWAAGLKGAPQNFTALSPRHVPIPSGLCAYPFAGETVLCVVLIQERRRDGDCLLNGAEANYSTWQQERLGRQEKTSCISWKGEIYLLGWFCPQVLRYPTVCHEGRSFSLKITSGVIFLDGYSMLRAFG